jgi:2-methylisocitrate lyase-like PEP mutase family enzyme
MGTDTVDREAVRHQAKLLRVLHAEGTLVLPHAWDVASAALIADVGAAAIATTSARVVWRLGRRVPAFVISARTDGHLRRIGDPQGRRDEVLRPAAAYAAAGANRPVVPGLADLTAVESLVARSPLPINASTGPAQPTVAQLGAAGVRRVSIGPAPTLGVYTVARQQAAELLTEGQLTATSATGGSTPCSPTRMSSSSSGLAPAA